MFPAYASANTVPRGGDAVVKFRTAANRSRLPEPLRLFAYILQANTTDLQWYDEAYGVITAGGIDSRLPQTWFGSTDFIRTVNLITALDQLESDDAAGTHILELPDHKVLLHYLNSHDQLLRLHPDAELQYHPALAHWVKTLLLWSDDWPTAELPSSDTHIRRIVVRYVKHILIELSQSHEDAPGKVLRPSVFLLSYGESASEPKLSIESYISILDKEAIPWRTWYQNVLPERALALGNPREEEKKTGTLDGAGGFEEWYAMNARAEAETSPEAGSAVSEVAAQDPGQSALACDQSEPSECLTMEEIVKLSQKDPDQAQQMLVNLPIDLASMEVINGVLSTGKANLENRVVACNYIQHGLRKLEDTSSDGSTGTNDSDEPYSPSLDPEEKKRKVKLLVLFIRNLIRRGLVPIDSLQYDIQEICVRYAPIKEVRELNHWFQTGEEL
ncbi:hypothetical protein UCRNP2_7710 [Neofusicoccum parvum UCRNP2]|uniref:Uncharacterized protein n=1 Tax=Botryosphaeria parva (strain UCR-NP2) TaxID=1287680 RepID=R1EDP0_BOTPV|nr:hypothetical protein UCRNP2_7710 [Neofusicoccum parvum UCRNP2]